MTLEGSQAPRPPQTVGPKKLLTPGAPEAPTPAETPAATAERSLSFQYPEGDEATKAKIDTILANVSEKTTEDSLLAELNALEGVTAEFKE